MTDTASRIGALVARSPACRDVVMHQQILDAANAFLTWGGFLPYQIEPQFNTIWDEILGLRAALRVRTSQTVPDVSLGSFRPLSKTRRG